MSSTDRLYRFVFERADVRGEILRLDEAYQRALAGSDHPQPVARLLGEAMVAAGLLTATIKFHGTLILQLQSQGPVRLLVVQAGSDGAIRAMVRASGEVPEGPLDRQARRGTLAITIDPRDGTDRYQGIVDLAAGSVAGALEKYFRDSEQLSTRVWLAADGSRAAGMLLQRVPGDSEDDDAWGRAEHLAETVTRNELLELEPQEILYRLFHEEDLRLFDPMPFRFRCRCSRERIEAVILAMGEEEARSLLEEQGQIEVGCDFCNEVYRFDPVDVERLLAGPGTSPPSGVH